MKANNQKKDGYTTQFTFTVLYQKMHHNKITPWWAACYPRFYKSANILHDSTLTVTGSTARNVHEYMWCTRTLQQLQACTHAICCKRPNLLNLHVLDHEPQEILHHNIKLHPSNEVYKMLHFDLLFFLPRGSGFLRLICRTRSLNIWKEAMIRLYIQQHI